MQHIQCQQNNNSVSVNLLTSEGYITLGSQYSAPSSNLKEDLTDWECRKGLSRKLLVLGDFNAYSKLWGYAEDDDRGSHVINHMSSQKLIVVNDPYCKPIFQSKNKKG